MTFGDAAINNLSPLVYQVDHDLIVNGIVPKFVSSSPAVGSYVTLAGLNFGDYTDKKCRFGSELTTAMFVSKNKMLCKLPSVMNAGILKVALTLNGYDFAAAGSVVVQTEMTLQSITPQIGTVSGYTGLSLTGTGLDHRMTYFCVVGGVSTAATVSTSGDTISCMSPPAVSGSGTVDVRVMCANTTISTTNSVSYEYVASPAITSMLPASGLSSGGSLVTFTLSAPVLSSMQFVQSKHIMCEFVSGAASLAKSVNFETNTVICEAPAYDLSKSVHKSETIVPRLSFNGGIDYAGLNADIVKEIEEVKKGQTMLKNR